MKRLLWQSGIFIFFSAGIFLFILSFADGYTDPYYLRFTVPKQENIIVGTSRSAQGLMPAVFSKVLNRKFYNFSFTMTHSPFGSVYFDFIKNSVKESVNNGIFVISVEPWSISSNGKNPNESQSFIENKLPLAKVKSRAVKPNFEYLLKSLSGKYYTVISNKNRKTFLHDDGWLEISVSMDAAPLKIRVAEKMESYRKKNLPGRKFSTTRLEYLIKTIRYLKQHGKVYLVRMPISQEMFQLEQQFMPNFNQIIRAAVQESNGYLDMIGENNQYQYTDGNHLWKDSGKIVSEKIARWILGKEKK